MADNRYELSYTFQGDQNQEDVGDSAFIGMDQKTDDIGAIAPRYCRLLQNARLNNGSLMTRDGLFALGDMNIISYGTIYGLGIFSDPNSLEYLLIAVSNGVWAVRHGTYPIFIPMQGTVTISGPVQMVQQFGVVTMFMGALLPNMYWNGDLTPTSFGPYPPATYPNVPMQSGVTGTYAFSRLWVPYGKSNLAASSLGVFYQYDPIFGSLNIDSGRDDNLVAVTPWTNNQMVCMKSQSIYILSNAAGDLGMPPAGSSTIDTSGLPSLQCLASGIGLCGKRAFTYVGTDIWFMSQQGVYSLVQQISQSAQVNSVPMSDMIKPTIAQINWQYGSGISAATRKERVYFAVPLGNSKRNNTLLVYNLVNSAWESIDTFDATQNFCPDDLYVTDYLGDRRIFAIDMVAGIVAMLEEGGSDIYYTNPANAPGGINERPIQFVFQSRGVSGSGDRSNFKRLSTNMATIDPNLTITVTTAVPGEVQVLASALTNSTTKYDLFGKPDWNTDNVNNDAGDPYKQDYTMELPFRLNGTTGSISQGCKLNIMREKTYRFPSRLMATHAILNISSTSGQVSIRNFSYSEVEAERSLKAL
jgi:hypothetical protein